MADVCLRGCVGETGEGVGQRRGEDGALGSRLCMLESAFAVSLGEVIHILNDKRQLLCSIGISRRFSKAFLGVA